jgi:hypothetical protein
MAIMMARHNADNKAKMMSLEKDLTSTEEGGNVTEEMYRGPDH